MFEIIATDTRSRARCGKITTAHGVVETPAFVVVGTYGNVRCVSAEEVRSSGTQLIIANTYHLWRTLGARLNEFEGLHASMGWNGPLMTDSGGYQVFSLGFRREHGLGKVFEEYPSSNPLPAEVEKNLVRITNDGAWFEDQGKEYFLGPAESMMIQERLGADIIFAFDECTSPVHNYGYVRRALELTNAWEKRCLELKHRQDQMLYGIVQGSVFQDLREASSQFVASLPFDGFGIGGPLGRREMQDVLRWSTAYLPEIKPRHLLGIGSIAHIFMGVRAGMDTFDCVIPTREARHGRIWTKDGYYDIHRGKWAGDLSPIAAGCNCLPCGEGMTKGILRELFSTKNPDAGRFATLHNIFFFNNLFREIREHIASALPLEELAKEYGVINF